MNTNRSAVFHWALAAVLALLFFLSLAYFVYDNIQAGSDTFQMVSSTLLLSIPLALLYGSAGLLIEAWDQQRAQGRIDRRLAAWIYRGPRIAGIVIVLFVSLFALDVFSMEGSIWLKLGAFVIHALPAIVMAVLLVLAWRWEWIGFAAFLLGGIFFLRFARGELMGWVGIVLLFTGPMLAVALLFWANWRWKKMLRA